MKRLLHGTLRLRNSPPGKPIQGGRLTDEIARDNNLLMWPSILQSSFSLAEISVLKSTLMGGRERGSLRVNLSVSSQLVFQADSKGGLTFWNAVFKIQLIGFSEAASQLHGDTQGWSCFQVWASLHILLGQRLRCSSDRGAAKLAQEKSCGQFYPLYSTVFFY